jgi:hypothetical protein
MTEKKYTIDEIEAAARGALVPAEALELLRERLVAPAPTKPLVGIYNDLGPDRSLSYAQDTLALGLDEEAIMLESFREGFEPIWEPSEYRRYHELTPGVTKSLVVWPEPTDEWFVEFQDVIRPYLREVPTFAIDLDAEMRWKERHVEGFPNLRVAGDTIMAFLRGLKSDGLIQEIQTDTFPSHVEAHGNDRFDGEDIQYIQSYTQTKPERDFHGRFGPRQRPHEDYHFVRAKGNDEALGVVLAAWNQDWVGHASPGPAMAFAAKSALRTRSPANPDVGYQRFRWWSLKHVVGPRSKAAQRSGLLNAVRVIRESLS